MRIGLDIGGTKTDAVLLDADGAVVRRVRRATGFGAEAVLDGAERLVREVLRAADVRAIAVDSVGVGIPGVVDEASGRVRHAVNLGIDDLDLALLLAARIGADVRVENDVKTAALGAYHLLGLRGSAALLNLGTGLAVGIVVAGRVWRGARGGAGEIGHIPVDPAGALCSCGQRGCLETIASGSAVARMWPTAAEHPAAELFDRADAGDVRARSVRDTLVRGIAAAVRAVVLTVDVDTIALGGGLTHLGERLREPVIGVLQEWSRTSPFLASLGLPDRLRLLPAELGAAAVGAALLGGEARRLAPSGGRE